MLIDYFSIGSNEVWSSLRTSTYLQTVGSPFTSGASWCSCPTLTRRMLDPDGEAAPAAYDTPATDPAPWYDADVADSGRFLGFLPLSMTGLDDSPRARNITNGVGGGGVFGPSRTLPRTITVTGLLIGTSCCAVDYGLHWLAESLAGCTGDSCDGDCVEMFNCCPDTSMTRAAFLAQHRRSYRRVALMSGPNVTDRVGTGGSCAAGTCGANGDILQVEFVLTAATPWPWTDETPLLDVDFPIGGSGACIEWCLSHAVGDNDPVCIPGECAHAECTATTDPCADPLKAVPAPPVPTAPDPGFCIPLAPVRTCFSIDLTARPQWSSDVPMITVLAGSSELRNVRISMYEQPTGTTQSCAQIADQNRCSPVNDFFITYIPAGGAVTIDGQTGRATTECDGDCRTASTVFGSEDGGPVQITELTCAQYCVCLESDPTFPPAADSGFTLGVSGRVF